ncbi:MAG: hypothetical protein LUF04_06320 [Bacteroides sp.]|nr:hypothetical protein [Bacteroides sp.]
MKHVLFRSMLLLFVVVAFGACEEKDSGELSYEELQRQLEQMRLILENNTKIVSVSFVDDEMVLTFATGETINTSIPANVIPQIGSNGNWWINGVDLGVSAEGKAPTIGSNGNWWIGTEDTGVKAEGAKGDKGDQGEKGTGISHVSYDPETAILKITLDDGSSYSFVIGATGEGNIGGNLIGDLNGEFLLTSITNGDLPFITLTYDDANNLTNVDYYTTVFNAPERLAGLNQVYGANGRVSTHRLTEYAEADKVLPVSNVFEDREYYYEYEYEEDNRFLVRFSALQLYRELFPSGFKDIVYGDIFIEYFVNNCWHNRYLYNTNYVYRWYGKSGNDYLVYKYPRQIFFTRDEWYAEDRKCILASDNGQNYFYLPYNYTSEYYGDEKNEKRRD